MTSKSAFGSFAAGSHDAVIRVYDDLLAGDEDARHAGRVAGLSKVRTTATARPSTSDYIIQGGARFLLKASRKSPAGAFHSLRETTNKGKTL